MGSGTARTAWSGALDTLEPLAAAGPGGMTLTKLGDAAEAQSPDELGIAVRDAADQVTVALGGPPFAVRAKGEHG
jgi:hypothetical protein